MKPDCVLLDIGMPHLVGKQVARELREREAPRGCLVVAVTGWGQLQDRASTHASAFDATR